MQVPLISLHGKSLAADSLWETIATVGDIVRLATAIALIEYRYFE